MRTPLTCLILVGGLGTRLRPALGGRPKALAPVAGRPFLERLLAQLAGAGCGHVVLCTGYRADAIEGHLRDGGAREMEIEYSREEVQLGTGGAVALARRLVRTDPFLVMNGDSYCECDFERLRALHLERGATATLAAARVEDRSRYGSLTLGPNDEVLSFSEKGAVAGAGRINGGVYLLGGRVWEYLPSGPTECSLERDVFPRLAAAGGLYALRCSGAFIDIGTPEDLARAQRFFAREGT